MTYQHPQDRDDPTKSIEDLCKPISAKVMPHSALYDMQGKEKPLSRVLLAQRTSASTQRVRRKLASGEDW